MEFDFGRRSDQQSGAFTFEDKVKVSPSCGRGQGDHTSARPSARATPPLPQLALGSGAIGVHEEARLPRRAQAGAAGTRSIA